MLTFSTSMLIVTGDSDMKVLFSFVLLIVCYELIEVRSFATTQTIKTHENECRNGYRPRTSELTDFYDRYINQNPLRSRLYGIDFDAIEDSDECDFLVGDCFIQHTTPSPDLTPEDVVSSCMNALSRNDHPEKDNGLEVCYNFSSDRLREGKRASSA